MKGRRTRAGVAGSALLHLLFVTAAIMSLPRNGSPPDPQGFQVTLVPLHRRLQPPSARQVPKARTTSQPASAAPPITFRAATPSAPSPAFAPQLAIPGPAAGDDQGRATLTGLLRGSFGCSEAKFLKLSQTEQDRCEQWRREHVDPNLEIPAPIAPEKRAWYDATLAARHAPDHPPGFVCGMLIDGIHLVKPKTPPHTLKLGSLPCYVVPPKWGITEDADIGSLSRQDSRGKTLNYTPKTFLSNGKPGPGGPTGMPGS